MKIDPKEVIADLRKHVKLDLDLDGFMLSQIDKLVIPIADSILAKINKAIPGQIDDLIVAQIKPTIYKEVKEDLIKIFTKLEDKIEDSVNGKHV